MTNQTPASDKLEQNVVEFGDSPGRRLRVQRQSRGMAVERVASQLHLKAEIIEALEQDRFDLLPDPVFVMGYMRNYARALGLDPAPLIAAYQSQVGLPQIKAAPAHSIQSMGPDSGGGRLLVRLVSLALVAAMMTMVALWWRDMPEQSPELAPDLSWESPDSAMAPLASGDAGEALDAAALQQPTRADTDVRRTNRLDPSQSAGSSAPLIAVMPGAGRDEGASLLAPAAMEPSRESPPAPALDESSTTDVVDGRTAPASTGTAPGLAESGTTEPATSGVVPTDAAGDAAKGINLEFTGPSWLTVTDAAGTTLFNGEMKDGDRHPVAGQAPFRFVIGRVGNTRMTLDGQPVDLETRSRGGVARFSFNPESPE